MVKKVTKTEATQVENTAVVEAPKAPAKKAPVKKVPAKAKKESKAAKPAKEPKDKSGLNKPQVRILQALAKATNGLTRPQLAEKAKVDGAWLGTYAGYANPEINARPEHAGNLVNRKLVKMEVHDVDGKDVITYSITALGKKQA